MQWVDYLYAREEEGMGPSVPLAASSAVTWFQKTAGLRDDDYQISRIRKRFYSKMAEMYTSGK